MTAGAAITAIEGRIHLTDPTPVATVRGPVTAIAVSRSVGASIRPVWTLEQPHKMETEKCEFCCVELEKSSMKKHKKSKGHRDRRSYVEKKQCSLFVTDFNEGVTKEELTEVFSKYEKVNDVVMKGMIAFVEFASPKAPEKIKQNGRFMLKGRHLRVDFCKVHPPINIVGVPNAVQQAELQAREENEQMELCLILEGLHRIPQVSHQMLQLESRVRLNEYGQNEGVKFVQKLERVFRRIVPEVTLLMYGSTQTGLGFVNCDIDIKLQYDNNTPQQGAAKQPLNLPHRCAKLLASKKTDRVQALSPSDQVMFFTWVLQTLCRDWVDRIQPIARARVPIMKCHHKHLGLDFDISFGGDSLALHNTTLLSLLCDLDPRVRPLVLTVKTWARQAQVCDSVHGRLSSYSLNMLVYTYLQNTQPPVLPSVDSLAKLCVPSEQLSADGWDATFSRDVDLITQTVLRHHNDQSLAELLRGFFYFYANLDLLRCVVCPRSGDVRTLTDFRLIVGQEETGSKMGGFRVKDINIQDPFRLSQNTAQMVQTVGARHISQAFLRAATAIESHYATWDLLTFIPVTLRPLTPEHTSLLMYSEANLPEWFTMEQTPQTGIKHWYKWVVNTIEDVLRIFRMEYTLKKEFVFSTEDDEDDAETQPPPKKKVRKVGVDGHQQQSSGVPYMDHSDAVDIIYSTETYKYTGQPLMSRLIVDTEEVTHFMCETTHQMWMGRRTERGNVYIDRFSTLSILDKEEMVSRKMLAANPCTTKPQRYHLCLKRFTYGHETHISLDIENVDGGDKSFIQFFKPYVQKLLRNIIYPHNFPEN